MLCGMVCLPVLQLGTRFIAAPIDVYSLPEDTSPENTSYHSGGKPYNPDARLQSRQIYLQYSSQLDYEDVARSVLEEFCA